MNYKLICMDFDGTLLRSDKTISKKTINTLNRLKENGFIIVGVTGRNFNSASSACNIKMFNYLILNNGAHIYDVKNNLCDSISYLDNEIIKSIFLHFKDRCYAIDFCSFDKYFMFREQIDESKSFLVRIKDINDINETICRINLFAENDVIEEYYEYISKNYKNKINPFIMMDSDDKSNLRWIAINPNNLNKGFTIKILCKKLNIKIDECIFFGDSANDVEAIETAGLGVAMGNAINEVKEKANDIALSNDEDGIANYLIKKINI